MFIAQAQFKFRRTAIMSLAGSSSDPPGVRQSITGGRPDDKNRHPPLGLIIYRHGLPLPDVTYDEAGKTDKNSESQETERQK